MHLGGASMLQLVTTDHKSIYMTSHTKKQLARITIFGM